MNRLHRVTEKTLVTMHSIRDRQTDGQHYHANGRSYCVQYLQFFTSVKD